MSSLRRRREAAEHFRFAGNHMGRHDGIFFGDTCVFSECVDFVLVVRSLLAFKVVEVKLL